MPDGARPRPQQCSFILCITLTLVPLVFYFYYYPADAGFVILIENMKGQVF